jgi:hypothetical protein
MFLAVVAAIIENAPHMRHQRTGVQFILANTFRPDQ